MSTTVFPGEGSPSPAARGFSLLYAVLFAAAFIAALFFNGVRIEFFALSMALLALLFFVVLWRGYDRGAQLPATPVSIALTLFWAWLAITLLWSKVPYVSMVNFWWLGGVVFVFWLTTVVPGRHHFFPGAYLAVLAIGLVLALLSIYQQLLLGIEAQSTFLTRNSHAALMCLIAIPASSHFLQTHERDRVTVWTGRLLLPVLFVLYFSIALTSSRGVILGLVLGFGVMTMTVFRYVPRRRLAVLIATVLTSFVIANFALKGQIVERLGTLMNPATADLPRFLIWENSWRMLMDEPWWGIGLGTYWLHWPPYRHPDDISAGFYVHNDYLQIWIEAGLPGLLLLLAICIAVLITFTRLIRHPQVGTAETVEAAGLFGGMLAIAAHTFFDFDLYIYPIQLALGLVLGRMHALYLARVGAPVSVAVPTRRISARTYRAIGFLALLLLLAYFAALGGSALLTYKARSLAAQKKWIEASTTLSRASQLMPTSDIVLIAHADLLRQVLTHLPRTAGERAVLFREAVALLENAERVNPLRPQIFFMRGLLYQQNADLAGPAGMLLVEQSYATALKRDPLAFWAREAYGRVLLQQGRRAEARRELEDGMAYQYAGKMPMGYYMLTADLRRQSGDLEGARALHEKLAEMQQDMRARAKRFSSSVSPEPSKKP